MHDEKLEGALLERFCSEWILRGVSLVKDFLPSVLTLLVGLPSSPLGVMIFFVFFCVHLGSPRSNLSLALFFWTWKFAILFLLVRLVALLGDFGWIFFFSTLARASWRGFARQGWLGGIRGLFGFVFP